jgi:octaprenyl-diphosphate synthase
MGDQLRVKAKSRDELQSVIATLREQNWTSTSSSPTTGPDRGHRKILIPEPQRAGKTASRPPRAPMTREQIFALIGDKLALVNERFEEEFGSNVEIVGTMGRHVAGSGGKRLRPALLLLGVGRAGYVGEQDVLFARGARADPHGDARPRRHHRRGHAAARPRVPQPPLGQPPHGAHGGPSLHHRDAARDRGRDFRILSLLAETTLGMIEGEMIQKDQNGRLDIDENEHLEVVAPQDGDALRDVLPRSGDALLPGSRAAARAGELRLDLGMAYQLVDDLLDFTADEETTGKPT